MSIDAAEWRRARAAVLEAADNGGRPKFLNGPPEQQLRQLVTEHGVDQVLAWLPESPAGLGVPRLVEWLVDRPHQPDEELVEQLRRRAEAEVIASGDLGSTGAGMGGYAPPVEGPRYREFTGHQYEQDQPAAPEVAAAARAALRGAPSDPVGVTMETSTGGTHP